MGNFCAVRFYRYPEKVPGIEWGELEEHFLFESF